MNAYLGEKVVEQEKTPFSKFDKIDWALFFIEQYGDVDGEHHKAWVLDQIARVLNDTPVEISRAEWSNGYGEWRVNTGEASDKYNEWVEENFEFGYDVGIAP